MAVLPTNSSSVPTAAPMISMTSNGDSLLYPLPVSVLRWELTTAATSTWTLHVTQSSAVAASTAPWPVIGPLAIGGTTAILDTPTLASMEFTVNQWVFGLVLTTISGGTLAVVKAPPGLDWVTKKPYVLTTVSA